METTNKTKEQEHQAWGGVMDESQLQALLEEHHAASFGWALSCCAQKRGEAEDVLQNAYLKILQGRARFGGRSAFKTWLFSVIRRTAADERRRHWFSGLRVAAYAEERAHEPAATDGGNPIEGREKQAAFRAALARLPLRQREVLHLVFYQDLTVQEAAAVMQVGIGSARTHYERGKQRLREWLGTEYGHEG